MLDAQHPELALISGMPVSQFGELLFFFELKMFQSIPHSHTRLQLSKKQGDDVSDLRLPAANGHLIRSNIPSDVSARKRR